MKKGLLTFVGVMCILVAGWMVYHFSNDTEVISADVAKQRILEQYGGELTDFTVAEGYVYATIKRTSGMYEVRMETETGRIVKVERKTSVQKEASSNPEKVMLSEEEAVQAALNEMSGTVDDIDFEKQNGDPYYLIEIEREKEGEAIVQVHAVTGEIMTITREE